MAALASLCTAPDLCAQLPARELTVQVVRMLRTDPDRYAAPGTRLLMGLLTSDSGRLAVQQYGALRTLGYSDRFVCVNGDTCP